MIAIDWGAWAVHFVWLFVGALAGFLAAAVMCVAGDSQAEAAVRPAQDPRVRALEARLAESEAARTRAEAAKTFYYDLYCALLTEAQRRAVQSRN